MMNRAEMNTRLNWFGIGLLLLFCMTGMALRSDKTPKGNEIDGVWLTQSKESMIEISNAGNNYLGKIIWLKFPISPFTHKAKVDVKNPDPKLRDRPIIGLNLLIGFKYSTDTKIGEGDIYDPKSGTTYNCKVTLVDPNTLNIRGYIGALWMGLGRTEIWKRIK